MDIDFAKEYKIYQTLLKMLAARSYIIPEEKKYISEDQLRSNIINKSDAVEIFFKDSAQKGIGVVLNSRVRYEDKAKVTEKTIENLTKTYKDELHSILIVVKREDGKETLAVEKKALEMAELAAKGIEINLHFEFFKQQNLMFNIMEHELVPEHILLTKEEKAKVLQKYKVKDSQLPKILLTDPVAQFLGLKRGDVVRIKRRSETAGTYITYRIAC